MKNAKKAVLISSLGWMGVVCILCAYAGNSFLILSSQSILYLILNVVGSIGIVIEARYKKDIPAMSLNIVWTIIACIGILRTL